MSKKGNVNIMTGVDMITRIEYFLVGLQYNRFAIRYESRMPGVKENPIVMAPNNQSDLKHL